MSWKLPDCATVNEIDQVLIQKIFRLCITDIRSYRGADSETDRSLVVTKLKLKLQSQKELEKRNNVLYNLGRLRDNKIQPEYAAKLRKYVENIGEVEIEREWNKISKAIKQVTK